MLPELDEIIRFSDFSVVDPEETVDGGVENGFSEVGWVWSDLLAVSESGVVS